MKILGTGLTGLVGSRFVELLGENYDIEYLNEENRVNILDRESVFNAVLSSKASVVLHMAAKTNVDGCEKDEKRDKEILGFKNTKERETAWLNEQTAWGVNVFGTQNVLDACQKSGKKIIYISTDFVFSGQKKSYTEDDKPGPVNWYAKTKYEGEKLVRRSGISYIIARPAYPYRALFQRNDFVRLIISKLEKRENLKMVTDHIIRPTFIDDIINALDVLIQKEEEGIFHITGSQTITPYDAALKIARQFDLDESVISKTTRREYFEGKASRPFCLNLKNDKIGKLGIEMSSFDEGLRQIDAQIKSFHI